MGNPRIFVDKRRDDLFNPSGDPHWLYYLTGVLQVLFLIAFIWGVGLVLVTAYVPHTHFQPGQLNNNLYSERFTSLWWLALFFASMRFFFFLSMQSMFLYRNTLCCGGRYAGCTIFWMMILFGLCALDTIALVININYLATCNGIHAVGNPCNDPAWCCRAEVHANSANHCPNTLTCPGGGPPIEPDKLFLAIFALNVLFVVLELYFILLPMMLWFVAESPQRLVEAEVDQEDEVNAKQEEEQTKQTAEAALLSAELIPLPPPTIMDNASGSKVLAAAIKLRRPPQTPMLAAAAAAAASGGGGGGPIVHVTPFSEKNTKQP
jgi:hypothetical protein